MSYATNSDVERRLGSVLYVQLTDDAGTGSGDEEKVTAARVAAEGEVNSYLGRRYSVPVTTTGNEELAALLQRVTLDLAEYQLHARRPPVPGEVAARQVAAVAWLERVASGRVVLPSVVELPPNTSEGPSASVRGSARVWGRSEAEGL